MSLYWFFEKVAQDEEAAGLTLQKALFKLSGVFLWDPPNKMNAIYPILPMFFINIVAILNFLQVFRYSIHTLHDFTEMILTLIVALVFASSGLKLILLHWSKNYIKELVDFLESLPRLESYKKVKHMEGVCMLYMYILIFTAIPKYCLGIMKGELPFESAWPFDTKTTVGWWIAYSTDILSANFCWFAQSSLDTLLVMSVTLMAGHLARLRKILSSIGKDTVMDERVIKSAIKLHVDLLHGADLVNSSYGILIMFQSLYAIVHAVIIIFYLVK
ncbi:Odorant receptor 131, partial [Halyomorpha halys]